MKYKKLWETARFQIDDMNDLLRCYYSTVNVVRIPEKNRYGLLHNQEKVLYNIILDCCNRSSETKEGKRMLADVDEFGLYLSMAFDHFSESLDVPFDFVKACLQHNPPPETMVDNMWYFTKLVHRQNRSLKGQISQLFDLLTPMIASCILLDSYRKRIIGKSINQTVVNLELTA